MKKIYVFLLFALLANQSFAQSERVRELISEQLLQAGIIFTAAGFELTHDIKFASLSDGRADTYTLNLQSGYDYKITAACDGDCGDIDLKLYDANYNLVDSDIETDDRPVVGVSPLWSGQFNLWVRMYDCSVSPCYFGIAVFGK